MYVRNGDEKTGMSNCRAFLPTSGLPDGIYIFKPKIQVWENFGGPCKGRCWYIIWPFALFCVLPFDIFCGRLANFMVIWYIFPRLGMLYQENSGNPDLHTCEFWRHVRLSASTFPTVNMAIFELQPSKSNQN
jgi:hypothetical protein